MYGCWKLYWWHVHTAFKLHGRRLHKTRKLYWRNVVYRWYGMHAWLILHRRRWLYFKPNLHDGRDMYNRHVLHG